MEGGPLICFDGVLEETKTVAGLEVAEEARGSQDCEPEYDPATDGVDVVG